MTAQTTCPLISPAIVLRTIARAGVWQVFENAVWFGDYVNKQPAIDAARGQAARIVSGGGEAVFIPGAEGDRGPVVDAGPGLG